MFRPGALAAAVAGVADARRSLVQFSMSRLWWLVMTDAPTLVSMPSQLRELLAELPDHSVEQARTEKVVVAAGLLKLHHPERPAHQSGRPSRRASDYTYDDVYRCLDSKEMGHLQWFAGLSRWGGPVVADDRTNGHQARNPAGAGTGTDCSSTATMGHGQLSFRVDGRSR